MSTRVTPSFFGIGMMLAEIGIAGAMLGCSKPAVPAKPPSQQPSAIHVEVRDGGPIVITTTAAEFQVLPSGYVHAALVGNGKPLTLDEPVVGSTGGSDSVVLGGKELDFIPDFSQAKVLEAGGKLGRGKRVEIPSRPLAPTGVAIERVLVVQAYDDFPNIALVSATYKNVGTTNLAIDQVWMQQHRFNATNVDEKAHPYDMWAFQGSSYDWGKDDVGKLSRTSSQPNAMGEAVKGGYGGGIPVVAMWTSAVGEAIGHVETLPWTLSIPVKVDKDGRVNASIAIPVNASLKPGDRYETPRSFVAVDKGDFYEPLRVWSRVLQKEGWESAKPSNEADNVNWCGWGYECK